MSLSLRIFVAYCVIVILAALFFFNTFMSELKPGMRQSSEDALVDTANLLAELVTQEFVETPDALPNFTSAVTRFQNRQYRAAIYTVDKPNSNLRIYITDHHGIVRFDSANQDLGADYSQWNDVYLTLRGQYGARSTKSDPDDEFSTVMHVAAPIKQQDKIIGVLTVAKPNFTVQPFIDLTYTKLLQRGILLTVFSLFIVLLIAFLLTRSIRKLVTYADSVSHGNNTALPVIYESELSRLANAIENMKIELEGKDYVEKYIHTLTHELKSPISAIKGANELLSTPLPIEDQKRFIGNIDKEITRMDDMINRLLLLAKVEKTEQLTQNAPIDLSQLINQLIERKLTMLHAKALEVSYAPNSVPQVHGDEFLLTQALDNLLQNAIEFAEPNTAITVDVGIGDHVIITIKNQGEPIPDYALPRIFERFYSLPRPHNQKKSSGLGLCFVKQIAELHGGRIELCNQAHGVKAKLSIKKR